MIWRIKVEGTSSTFGLLALLSVLALSGCVPATEDAAGQYFREKDVGMPLAMNLKTDGTFDSYNGSQTGQWHLVKHPLLNTVIELDGTNDFGKFEDQYNLTRHNGAFCIETHTDYEYWCKRR
jgi:hypothetical protein